MKVSVLGKNTFVSKKTGKRYYILDCCTQYDGTEGTLGCRVFQQYVNEDIYNKVSADVLGNSANIYYNQRGFVDAFDITK